MPNFYVNTNAQSNGDHEVHQDGCSHPPDFANRHNLGWFTNCRDAVSAAKQVYSPTNGCFWCCNECHTT